MKNYKSIFIICLGFILYSTQSLKSQQENGSYLKLWYQQPADEWMKSIPIGNGRLGALIYGGINTETIALNEVTLWSGQPDANQEKPCGKQKLSEIHQLFFEGKLNEGNQLASKYLSGQPSSFGTHLPLGNIRLKFDYDSTHITDYKHELNLSDAINRVSFNINRVSYKREYFCSNPDNVLAIKLSANTPHAISLELGLDLLRESDIKVSGNEITFTGRASFPKQGPGGVDFIGKIKVLQQGGKLQAFGQTLKIEKADEVVVLVDFRTNYKNLHFIQQCTECINKASAKPYYQLKSDHIRDYSNLFNRVELFLGTNSTDHLPTDIRLQKLKNGGNDPGLFSLFFQYGRYLLIAASRENSPLPANLQGIWNDNLACNMGWTCDYHLDINTEQNYWLANIGNLPECNSPLFKYIEDLSVHGSKTAATVYGSPGWVAHTVANVWGYTAPGQSVGWGLFPTASAWIASHLWDHYLYTQDIDFLKNTAYPILKNAAAFYLDYMVEDPNDGYLKTGPSTSPENSFRYKGNELSLSMMPTCDRVLVWENYTSCIEASKILNVDAGFRDSLQSALKKFPPIRISKDGTIQEWFDDFDLAQPNHRHSSHLLALYPFNQISPEHTPELAKAAEKSIYNQLHSKGWEDVEWSRANMICFYTRLKNSTEAYNNMKSLLVEFARENLFTPAPGGIAGAELDIYEFDANEAAPAAMAEMFVQSQNGYIEFLPALPQEWSNGYLNGLCVRGGATVDLNWKNGKVKKAIIKVTCSNTFNIKLSPQQNKTMKLLKNGQPQTLHTDANGMLSMEMKKGEVLQLTMDN